MIHLHLTIIYCFLLLLNNLIFPSYKVIRDKDQDYPSTLAPKFYMQKESKLIKIKVLN